MSRRDSDEVNEVAALRDEARHYRNRAKKADKRASEAHARAIQVVHPELRIEPSTTSEPGQAPAWWRVYVNDVYLDGYETEDTAKTIVERMRRAFAPKP